MQDTKSKRNIDLPEEVVEVPEPNQSNQKVSIGQLFRYAKGPYYVLFLIGVIGALLAGFANTGIFLVFREVLATIDPEKSDQEIAGKSTYNY